MHKVAEKSSKPAEIVSSAAPSRLSAVNEDAPRKHSRCAQEELQTLQILIKNFSVAEMAGSSC